MSVRSYSIPIVVMRSPPFTTRYRVRKSVGVGTVEWGADAGMVLLPPPQLDSRIATIRSEQTCKSVRHIVVTQLFTEP